MRKQIFKAVFLLLVCLNGFSQEDSLFLDAFKSPKKYIIGGISIEGADNTDKNVISLLSGLTVGDEITIPGDKTSEAIKALWKQSIFEDVQIIQDKTIGDNVFITIKVVERPRLSKFSFKGDVKKTDADEIRNKIRLMQGRVVTDYMVGTIKNTVKDYYSDKGYY
jgi:outer membrane protein insertion porin family